ERASKMSWYKNTLFVITSDHTALAEYPFYRSRVGMYSIPILYFVPGDSSLSGKSIKTTQQIDILPSIMDYLNYDQNYFAFGKSVFDSSTGEFAVNYLE